MNSETRCEEHLKRIAELLPLLLDALERSTTRETPNTPPGMEQTAAYKAERAERHQVNVNYLPENQVPPDLEVSQALYEMRLTLAEMHDIAQELVGLPQTCSRCGHLKQEHAGPGPCVKCRNCGQFRLTAILPTSPSWRALMASSQYVATAIEASLARVKTIMEYALDLTETGKLIMVPCPWCHGVTESMPEGSFTLRVYVPGAAPDTYVLCENTRCTPPAPDCGDSYHGRPKWPYSELDWLAKRLDIELDRIRDERERLLRGADAVRAS